MEINIRDTYKEGKLLKEEYGFKPLAIGTLNHKENLEKKGKQKEIIINWLSNTLDSSSYISEDFLQETILYAGGEIFKKSRNEKNTQRYSVEFNRARSYLPEISKLWRPFAYGRRNIQTLEEDNSIFVTGRDHILPIALNIPSRLSAVIEMEFCKKSRKIFFFKNKERLFEQLKKDFSEIYSRYGEFQDLKK